MNIKSACIFLIVMSSLHSFGDIFEEYSITLQGASYTIRREGEDSIDSFKWFLYDQSNLRICEIYHVDIHFQNNTLQCVYCLNPHLTTEYVIQSYINFRPINEYMKSYNSHLTSDSK